MQCSLPSCYLVPLRLKDLFQHLIHTYFQPIFLPQLERPSVTLTQKNRQNYSSVYSELYVFG